MKSLPEKASHNIILEFGQGIHVCNCTHHIYIYIYTYTCVCVLYICTFCRDDRSFGRWEDLWQWVEYCGLYLQNNLIMVYE